MSGINRADRARSKLGLFTVLAAKLRHSSRSNREVQERAMGPTKSSMLRTAASTKEPREEMDWNGQLTPVGVVKALA